MTARKKLGAFALVAAAAFICLLPAVSQGGKVDLRNLDESLRHTTQQLGNKVDQSLDRTAEALRKTDQALRRTTAKATADLRASGRDAKTRVQATDPLRQPPLHGGNPHGQGGVAVVDLNPSAERPLGGSPDGSDSEEDVIVGRARGEKNAAGAYHGHITIAALFGNELLGVDTAQGETKNGPLQGLQTGILDPLCESTKSEVCLSLLTANSTTTANGSTNDFAVARARLLGLGVGAAESGGTIVEDANCQTSTGGAKTVNVVSRSGAIAQVANSTSSSRSCRGEAPKTLNTSTVIALGGNGLPLPAAGCADGTPDTVGGLPPLLPIVCNADEIVGAAAVREALDVFVLTAGNTSLVKETTAASESVSVAPAGPEKPGPQCNDKVDNDGDGVIDGADPGCHSDNDAKNPQSYNPNDDDETDKKPTKGSGPPDDGGPGEDGGDEDGGGGGPGGTGDDSGAGAARTADADALPFTGTDVTGLALAGLLLLGGGLLMRRREGSRARL